jgi:hypothetical protein
MHRRALAALAVAAVLVLAGCGGTGPGSGTTTPTTPDPSPEYSATVFDSGPTDHPIIEGGLVPSEEFGNTSHYVSLLTDASDTDRFNRSRLPEDAAQFVDETDFETASLVVVQAYPKSSVPDYRVESVTRDGDTLDIGINDSSEMGTDDITLETVLLRVDHDGTPPSEARIETQNGVTFDTADGVVTSGHSPPAGSTADVELPLWSGNLSDNVNDPRDMTVVNQRQVPQRYNVSVVATFTPDCRHENPACGNPDYPAVVFQQTATLEPGERVTFANLIARHGTYDVIVEATPTETQRETVRAVGKWQVFHDRGDAHVLLSEEEITVSPSV